MDRDQQIATLNLQGWEPCAINHNGSPVQGIACGAMFYFAQDKFRYDGGSIASTGRMVGYMRFVDVTTALCREWDEFDDEDLAVLFHQAQVYMGVGHAGP